MGCRWVWAESVKGESKYEAKEQTPPQIALSPAVKTPELPPAYIHNQVGSQTGSLTLFILLLTLLGKY